MKETDKLITESLIPFRKELLERFAAQHPVLYTAAKTFLGKKESRIGMQITDGNYITGKYTFILNGIDITDVQKDIINPSFEVPMLGNIKMYMVMEEKDVVTMLQDKAFFTDEIIETGMKYMPAITLKFL